MRTEIRLKQILDAANLDTWGRIELIARETGIARHTIRKLYHNEARVFSLPTIGSICEWLEQNGLGEGLPGSLFALRPPELFKALTEANHVSMLVGVYTGRGRPGFRASVARDDFSVAARLVERLSRPSERAVGFTHIHVPSHVPFDGHELDRSVLEHDQTEAQRTLDSVRRKSKSRSTVMIGSQRANHAVECFVADLLNTSAFSSENSPVPFYLKYHEREVSSSCFGGINAPVPAATSAPVGIYFRHRNKPDWDFFPSKPKEYGTGMVIVRRDPGLGGVELAVFGLSGIATAAMGKLLCDMPDKFWPEPGVRAGIEVGVYVCGFKIGNMETAEQDIETITIEAPTIVKLDVEIRGRRRVAG